MDIKDRIIDIHFPNCPVRNVISRIGNKWSILVLLTLDASDGWVRYKQIQQAIPDVSHKMLTQTLRDLEADGLIERRAFAEVPPRVEYNLTARAHSLTPILHQLVQWAMDNFSVIINERKRYYEE